MKAAKVFTSIIAILALSYFPLAAVGVPANRVFAGGSYKL
jgi:hypothetical protein